MSLPPSVRLAARCAASLLTLLALATLAPAAVAQTATPTFTVTVLTDPATGTAAHCTNQAAAGATPDVSCALRDALAAVDALGYLGLTSTQPIVNFSSAVIGTGSKTITLASTLVVSHNVNLTGPGVSSLMLSGHNAVAILQQANTTSTPSLSSVSGLIFASGLASQVPSIGAIAGAAWLSSDAGVVNFLNVYFLSNNATASSSTSITGGTVLGYTVNLSGCEFVSNTASGSNASIGAILYAQTLNISSSFSGSTLFYSNSASGGTAGIVSANSVTIANATFASNTASEQVLFMGSGSIANTLFQSNTTSQATLLLTGTTTITNSTFYQNAGGIIVSGGSLTILTSSFINPLPVSGQSSLGAIYNASSSGTLTITGCSFTDPRTSGQSLYLLFNAGTAIVNNSLFTSSDSDQIDSTGPNLTMTGDTSIGVGLVTTASSSNATTTLYNDTIEASVEDVSSGNYTAATNAYNTIITGGTDSYGTITDKGGNCIYPGCTASLSALGSYGGPLQTVLPLPSPSGTLIFGGVATNINGATTDARGYPRTYTYGGHTFVDIGATQSSYTLAFAQQPTNSTTGTTITPAPTLQLYESGVPFALSGGNVYVAPSAGTLSGTTTQATNSSGLATFSNLSFAAPENSETLTAYLPISNSISLTATSNPFVIANKTAQTITFAQPANGVVGGSATLTASSTSGLPITFTVTSGSASLGGTTTSGGISSVTIFYLSAAPVTIAANQAGNSTYAAAPTVSRTVTVNAAGATAQTINFPQPRAGVTNGSATLTATSTSGLPVTFSIISGPASVGATTTTGSGPSTLSSATINYVNAGTVTIAADQSGNPTYAAAPTVTQTVTVYNNSVWLIDNDTTLIMTSVSGTNSVQSGQPVGSSTQGGIAFDATGNSWSVGNGSNTLRKSSSLNNFLEDFSGSGGISGPTTIAIDGNGYIWIANAGNNSIQSFDNSGNQLNGYAYGILHNPSAIAVDNTGGLWLTNQTGNSVTRIFGVAAPVATPLSSATANATLGAKP